MVEVDGRMSLVVVLVADILHTAMVDNPAAHLVVLSSQAKAIPKTEQALDLVNLATLTTLELAASWPSSKLNIGIGLSVSMPIGLVALRHLHHHRLLLYRGVNRVSPRTSSSLRISLRLAGTTSLHTSLLTAAPVCLPPHRTVDNISHLPALSPGVVLL